MSDRAHMAGALRQAARARGRTSPNPMVGCVIVRDSQVLATGYHLAAGLPHAEAAALAKLDHKAPGATVYVNLEPCSHFGRTPPCADALIRAGVARVVVGMIDPNPRVSGAGIQRLRDAGIQVEVGVLEAECRRLNEAFSHYIQTGRPFVTLKSAFTLDGRIATRTGASRWITSPAARRRAHRLRSEHDAVLVGVGTVLADDPRLTVREGGRKGARPLRVVLDTHLRTPPSAAVCDTAAAPTLIYCGPDAKPHRAAALGARGVEIQAVPVVEGRVDLASAMKDLGARQRLSLMVEGGGQIAGALVDQGLVNRYALFVAPRIFGGDGAPGFVGGRGVEEPAAAPTLIYREVRRVGPDLYIDAIPAAGG